MVRCTARVGLLVAVVGLGASCIPAPVLRPRDAEADHASPSDRTAVAAMDAEAPRDASLAGSDGATDTAAVMDADATADGPADDTTADAAHADAPGMDAGTCDGGQALRDGRCVEISPARPVWPMSTQTVTQRRPRLRWALGPEADGARVEVCRDRGCATRVASYVARGVEGAPEEDLPPGPLFWRVWARAGSAESLRPSVVWEVYIPWRSGSVHTAQRDTFDVNGDGYADLVVAVADRRELRLYLGSATGPRPAVVLTDPFLDPATMLLGRAGDVNGDGRSDLLVRYGARQWRVLYATERGFDLNARTDINLTERDASATLDSVDAIGDPNGDGYTDLAATSTTLPALLTRVGVHAGSGAGVSALTSEVRDGLAATSLRPMGDLNGDGYEDLATVAGDLGPPPATTIRVYQGQGSRLGWSTLGVPTSPGANVIRATGRDDFNGDGIPDVTAFGLFALDRTPILLGNRSGLDSVALFIGAGDGSSSNAPCSSDLNGDGIADGIIEARNAQSIRAFFGSASGPSPSAAVNLSIDQLSAWQPRRLRWRRRRWRWLR
ncbi:MAG: VCBS repeat-containing protein [Polyangiales bacterium]